MLINLLKKTATLLFFILLSSNVFAQENSPDSLTISNDCANHILDIYFINSYGLGYNFTTSNNSNIRVLLNIRSNYRSYDEDGTRTIYENENNMTEKSNSDNSYNYNNISLSINYLLDFYSSKYGDAYFGVGPILGYNWHKNNSNYETETRDDNYESSEHDYSLGLNALVGIRSKLSNSIYLFLESQFSGGKTWSDYEYTSSDIDINYSFKNSSKTERNGWYYNLIYTQLGIRISI